MMGREATGGSQMNITVTGPGRNRRNTKDETGRVDLFLRKWLCLRRGCRETGGGWSPWSYRGSFKGCQECAHE